VARYIHLHSTTEHIIFLLVSHLSQRESPLQVIRSTLQKDGFRGLYAGCSALVVGNAAKAGVRFLSYDTFKSMLADNEVRGDQLVES
jgi:hypothetical protein